MYTFWLYYGDNITLYELGNTTSTTRIVMAELVISNYEMSFDQAIYFSGKNAIQYGIVMHLVITENGNIITK